MKNAPISNPPESMWNNGFDPNMNEPKNTVPIYIVGIFQSMILSIIRNNPPRINAMADVSPMQPEVEPMSKSEILIMNRL